MNNLSEHIIEKWLKENKLNKEFISAITTELNSYLQTAFDAGMEEADEAAYDEGYADGLSDAEDELMSST